MSNRRVAPWTWVRALRDHGPRADIPIDRDFLCAMLVLSLYMDDSGKGYPSLRKWAAASRMAVNTLRKHKDRGVAEGWISESLKANAYTIYWCGLPDHVRPTVSAMSDTDGHSADQTVSTRVTQLVMVPPADDDVMADDFWREFKLIYPARAGDQNWRKAKRAATARMREGHSADDLIEGARRYAGYLRATGKFGTEFVKQAVTFLGPSKAFLELWAPPPSKAQGAQDQNVEAVRRWLDVPETDSLLPAASADNCVKQGDQLYQPTRPTVSIDVTNCINQVDTEG
jgi:hypothetical protein